MGTKQIECCDLCGGTEDILLPKVGIAFGMSGDDFSFCRECLEDQTAAEFWESVAALHQLKWPLVPQA